MSVRIIVNVRRSLLFAQTCLALSCAMLAGVAAAQANKEPVKNLSVVEVEYKSALSDFRPYNDQAIQSWVKANDLVGRIGGWRSYAKEVATGEALKDASEVPDTQSGHHGGVKP